MGKPRRLPCTFLYFGLFATSAGLLTGCLPEGEVERTWCVRGDLTDCPEPAEQDSGEYRKVIVLPTGFADSQYEDFRASFDDLTGAFAHPADPGFYSKQYGSRILFIAHWATERDLGGKRLEGGFLSVSPEKVRSAVSAVSTSQPDAVVTILNDSTPGTRAGSLRSMDPRKPYGITKLNRLHAESSYVVTHELGHALLNWADEYVEDGMDNLHVSQLNQVAPELELSGSWSAEFASAVADRIGTYDFSISEILADHGADNISTSPAPGRVEGAFYFGGGVFRESGATIMAGADAFAYAHSSAQRQTVRAAFEGFSAYRANDRLRTAGPTDGWSQAQGPQPYVLLMDADKHNRHHPTELYEIQLSWYEDVWDTCWDGPTPYPCQSTVLKTVTKEVTPSPRKMTLRHGTVTDSALLMKVLCLAGVSGASRDSCEVMDSGAPADEAQVEFLVPYQETWLPATRLYTTYYWSFRARNATGWSDYTPWAELRVGE